MLTRIRNALTVRKETVEIPASNMKREIARILLEEGYVKDVKETGEALKFIGIPVTPATYSSSVIPIILSVW